MNAYPAVGSCFLQGQIALFPDRDNNLPPTLIICLFHDNNHSCIHISESGASLHVVRVDFTNYLPHQVKNIPQALSRKQKRPPPEGSGHILTVIPAHIHLFTLSSQGSSYPIARSLSPSPGNTQGRSFCA